MAYARLSGASDVYLFDANYRGRRFVHCCACSLAVGGPNDECGGPFLDSGAKIVAHLRQHQVAGDLVPDGLLDATIFERGDIPLFAPAWTPPLGGAW